MLFHHHHRRDCGRGPRGFGRGHHGPRGFIMGWGMGAQGWGGEEEGGRRRRMFDGGELRLVLLKLIADEPRHGYDLIRQIEEGADMGELYAEEVRRTRASIGSTVS